MKSVCKVMMVLAAAALFAGSALTGAALAHGWHGGHGGHGGCGWYHVQ